MNAEIQGALVLFDSNRDGDRQDASAVEGEGRKHDGSVNSIGRVVDKGGEPLPLNLFHPNVSDWVI